MTIWYNEPKDGICRLSPTWDGIRDTIYFTELRILSTDKHLIWVGQFVEIEGLKKTGNFNEEYKLPQPILAYFIMNKKSYEKRTKQNNEWKTVTMEPSWCEKFWVWLFQQNDYCDFLGVPLTGSIFLKDDTMVLPFFLKGEKKSGVKLTPDEILRSITVYWHDVTYHDGNDTVISDDIIKKITDLYGAPAGENGGKKYSGGAASMETRIATYLAMPAQLTSEGWGKIFEEYAQIMGTDKKTEMNKFLDRIFSK